LVVGKFHKLSINDYYKYSKSVNDYIQANIQSLNKTAKTRYNHLTDSILLLYKDSIDAIIYEYRRQIELQNPSSYIKISWQGASKRKSDNRILFKFKITPLRGPISGAKFRYTIKNKLGSEYYLAGGEHEFAKKIESPMIFSVLVHENADIYKYDLSEIVISQDDFEYQIFGVVYNNEGYSINKLRNVQLKRPEKYRNRNLLDTILLSDYIDLIEDYHHISIPSEEELFNRLIDKEKQQINLTAYQLDKLLN
jgi:hypothetical protein